MDIEQISGLVGSLGFPIVACCFMAWLYVQMNETLKDLTLAITELTAKFESHFDRVEGE